jgi:hypothetical protein
MPVLGYQPWLAPKRASELLKIIINNQNENVLNLIDVT